MDIKVRVEAFEAYGLNSFRNFLIAPHCDCGCSTPASLLLRTRKELFGFMGGMVLEHGDPDGAIFAVGYDDKMYACMMNPRYEEWLLTNEEDEKTDIDPVIILGTQDLQMDFFKEIDAEFGLCCYGLIIETKPGHWHIVEN